MIPILWSIRRPDRRRKQRVGDPIAVGGALGSFVAAGVGKLQDKKPMLAGTAIPLLLNLAGHTVLAGPVPKGQPAIPLLAGQAFSMAGDAAMAQKTERSTLTGIAMFAGTHLCYLYGYLRAGALRGVIARPAIAAGYAGSYVVLGRMLWPRLDARMRWPATAYGALLFTTAVAAWATDANCGVGATLFAVSDVLIALRLAGSEFPSQRFLTYATYALGQYLVARHSTKSMTRQS